MLVMNLYTDKKEKKVCLGNILLIISWFILNAKNCVCYYFKKKNADIFIVTVLVLLIRKIIMSHSFVNIFIG